MDKTEPGAINCTERGYQIPSEWTFNRPDIANAFDKHVREQLPWYDLATEVVTHFGRHYLPKEGRMYDIGASRGNITDKLRSVLVSRVIDTHSIEVSSDMCEVWEGYGQLHNEDCVHFDYLGYDFAVVFLVLMFLPEKDRAEYMQRLYARLLRGGAIVVFDKVAHHGGYLGNVMARLTLSGKVMTGVPYDQIVAKELSLGGVQRPIVVQNIPVLRDHGVPIFQYGEFAGWVITKE